MESPRSRPLKASGLPHWTATARRRSSTLSTRHQRAPSRAEWHEGTVKTAREIYERGTKSDSPGSSGGERRPLRDDEWRTLVGTLLSVIDGMAMQLATHDELAAQLKIARSNLALAENHSALLEESLARRDSAGSVAIASVPMAKRHSHDAGWDKDSKRKSMIGLGLDASHVDGPALKARRTSERELPTPPEATTTQDEAARNPSQKAMSTLLAEVSTLKASLTLVSTECATLHTTNDILRGEVRTLQARCDDLLAKDADAAAEVERLSVELFSEANEMVAEERKARFAAEEREQAAERNAVRLAEDVQSLRARVEELVARASAEARSPHTNEMGSQELKQAEEDLEVALGVAPLRLSPPHKPANLPSPIAIPASTLSSQPADVNDSPTSTSPQSLSPSTPPTSAHGSPPSPSLASASTKDAAPATPTDEGTPRRWFGFLGTPTSTPASPFAASTATPPSAAVGMQRSSSSSSVKSLASIASGFFGQLPLVSSTVSPEEVSKDGEKGEESDREVLVTPPSEAPTPLMPGALRFESPPPAIATSSADNTSPPLPPPPKDLPPKDAGKLLAPGSPSPARVARPQPSTSEVNGDDSPRLPGRPDTVFVDFDNNDSYGLWDAAPPVPQLPSLANESASDVATIHADEDDQRPATPSKDVATPRLNAVVDATPSPRPIQIRPRPESAVSLASIDENSSVPTTVPAATREVSPPRTSEAASSSTQSSAVVLESSLISSFNPHAPVLPSAVPLIPRAKQRRPTNIDLSGSYGPPVLSSHFSTPSSASRSSGGDRRSHVSSSSSSSGRSSLEQWQTTRPALSSPLAERAELTFPPSPNRSPSPTPPSPRRSIAKEQTARLLENDTPPVTLTSPNGQRWKDKVGSLSAQGGLGRLGTPGGSVSPFDRRSSAASYFTLRGSSPMTSPVDERGQIIFGSPFKSASPGVEEAPSSPSLSVASTSSAGRRTHFRTSSPLPLPSPASPTRSHFGSTAFVTGPVPSPGPSPKPSSNRHGLSFAMRGANSSPMSGTGMRTLSPGLYHPTHPSSPFIPASPKQPANKLFSLFPSNEPSSPSSKIGTPSSPSTSTFEGVKNTSTDQDRRMSAAARAQLLGNVPFPLSSHSSSSSSPSSGGGGVSRSRASSSASSSVDSLADLMAMIQQQSGDLFGESDSSSAIDIAEDGDSGDVHPERADDSEVVEVLRGDLLVGA